MDNKSTVFSLIFNRHKTALYSKLRTTTIFLLIYSLIIVIAQMLFGSVFEKLEIQNIGQFHLIFSFVISILIAFRVNASYSRWWEGRGYWGTLVNNSRSLALKFNAHIGLNNEPQFMALLTNLPEILKYHLRKQSEKCEQLAKFLGIDVTHGGKMPTLVINQMYQIMNKHRLENKISLEQFLSMDIHLANLIDLVGGCEKIVNTPLPAQFKMFIRQALFFYMIIFPFGWVEKFGILIIPMVIVIIDVLLGLELVSEEIENPFSEDHQTNTIANGSTLDLDTIAKKIAQDIHSIANS